MRSKNDPLKIFESELEKFKLLSEKIKRNVGLQKNLMEEMKIEFSKLRNSDIFKLIESKKSKIKHVTNDWNLQISNHRDYKKSLEKNSSLVNKLFSQIKSLMNLAIDFLNNRRSERNMLLSSLENINAENLNSQLQRMSVSAQPLAPPLPIEQNRFHDFPRYETNLSTGFPGNNFQQPKGFSNNALPPPQPITLLSSQNEYYQQEPYHRAPLDSHGMQFTSLSTDSSRTHGAPERKYPTNLLD